MPTSLSHQIICRDEFIIDAQPSQVAELISDAHRILDYYPGGFRAENLTVGQQLACYGRMGASLLERDNEQSRENFLVFKVYSCMATTENLSADQLKEQAFFTMVEEWELRAHGQQTCVTKTWRSIEQPRLRFIPTTLLTGIIKLTAKLERQVLVRHWNQAARNGP